MSENLDDFEAFQMQFRSGNYQDYYDGGAYVNLPRFSCFKRSNHKFIINGIGEVLAILYRKSRKIIPIYSLI